MGPVEWLEREYEVDMALLTLTDYATPEWVREMGLRYTSVAKYVDLLDEDYERYEYSRPMFEVLSAHSPYCGVCFDTTDKGGVVL